MAEKIEINYKKQPLGQVGKKPRPVAPGTEIRFDCDEAGDFLVEFVGDSPLDGGAKRATRNQKVVAGTKPGIYKFMCSLDGVVFGDPATPGPGGGELEIGPG